MKEEIAKVQEAASTAIFREFKEPIPAVDPSFLNKIKNTNLDVLSIAVGKAISNKLSRFVSLVDFEHPNLTEIIGGILVNKNNDFISLVSELITLADFAISQKLSLIKDINNIMSRSATEYRDIYAKIDSPLLTQNMIRLLSSRIERDKLRLTRKMKYITLDKKTKELQELWDLLPNTFMNFIRFNNVYENDIREAQENANCFNDLGLDLLVASSNNDIKKLEAQSKNNYYGFNNILITQASIIQAKLLKFGLTPVHSIGIGVGQKIQINKAYFKNYNFWGKCERNNFNYVSHCYTYHHLEDIAPNKIKKIIDYLENFPDVGGRAIFDHFLVLVPSVDYPVKGYTTASYMDENAKIVNGEIEDISLKLDKTLIKKELSIPVLLGEKDGLTYFISYWSE